MHLVVSTFCVCFFRFRLCDGSLKATLTGITYIVLNRISLLHCGVKILLPVIVNDWLFKIVTPFYHLFIESTLQ